MILFRVTIDGRSLEVPMDTTLFEAAERAGIYIPVLCRHPDLVPAEGISPARGIYQGEERIENKHPHRTGKGCGLCVVEVAGESDLVNACTTKVRDGMVVVTQNDRIREKRRENLIPILARHPHGCLTCAQQDGCIRIQCSAHVPEIERCCDRFGRCEFQKIANYVGIPDATPKWIPTSLPVLTEDPLFKRDYNLCIGCLRCVRACRDLRGIGALGFVYDGDGRIQVGSVEPTLEESGCKFCTACVAVCPTGALMDKVGIDGKAEDVLVPCKSACPVGMDVPEYVRQLAKGEIDAACAVIRETVPFPGVVSRVCTRPCETVCRRKEVNAPIAVCALKRYAADREKGTGDPERRLQNDTGKHVAVVGAGPAGLTAAYYLRKKGHAVTVFDAAPEPGGMLRYGIPAYRLPREVLEKEIIEIFALGIAFVPHTRLGKDIHLKDLEQGGFDAVFLGIGAQRSRKILLEAGNLSGVLQGIDFLKKAARGEDTHMKENVLVIGGGNTGVDAARTALRCGAKKVSLVCLESKEDMPATRAEIERAEAEGVRLFPSFGPGRILSEHGRITGLEIMDCTRVFDEKGNFSPRFGVQRACVETDQIILAVGQVVDVSVLPEEIRGDGEDGPVSVNEEVLETPIPHIFAGGDAVAVSGSVIHAVAHGRKAAGAIDKFLGGDGQIDETPFPRTAPDPWFGREDGFARKPRVPVPESPSGKIRFDFSEIVLGYDPAQARTEAGRCLRCDARLSLKSNPLPPEPLLPLIPDNLSRVPETEGVFQILDREKRVLAIQGTSDLRAALWRAITENKSAAWFIFEEDKMYSLRESEWIQRHIQRYGQMPGFGEDDDLF
ncbi:MAG: FAD-dependent oxidoreductase [Deltaproteobacteria bacterium]|nr:FAD-dependent oxidoreductase [Deltaproteobacteria bacterium]